MRYLQRSKGDSVLSEYEIIIEAKAKADMIQIFEYIDNTLLEHNTASKIYLSIYNAINSLNVFPQRCGVIIKEPWHTKGIRRLLSGNYSIFFVIHEETHRIHIFRVIYSRRSWENII